MSETSTGGNVLGGRWELGPLLAVQGKDGCDDPRCTRMVRRLEDGTFELGPCMGYHCPYCGEPCSSMGHKACVEKAEHGL